MAAETLHVDIRDSALDYFRRHEIKWWTSDYDARTTDMAARPTGHLNSSQVACVNHLEPARVDGEVAQEVIANAEAGLTALPFDDGFVEYEWIGRRNYLGERGARTRGANAIRVSRRCGGRSSGARGSSPSCAGTRTVRGPEPVLLGERRVDAARLRQFRRSSPPPPDSNVDAF